MSAINGLSAIDVISGSDLIAIYSQQNGDARKTSVYKFANSVAALGGGKPFYQTFVATASFSITPDSHMEGDWVTLSGSSVSGNIILPNPIIDLQEITVTLLNSTITVNNWLMVSGAPIYTIATPSKIRSATFRYMSSLSAWVIIGSHYN